MVAITGCGESIQVLGNAMLYESDEQFLRSFQIPDIGPQVLMDIKRCLNNQASATLTYCTVAGEEVKVFIEVILPVMHLVLYGGGYDVHPLVRMARELGWNVTVVTNIHKADKSLFAMATEVLHSKGEQRPVIDNYSAIVLMAHDYKTDFNNLQCALETETRYIGLLGPRKRTQKMLDAMMEGGHPVSGERMQRIFSPSGLDIGAITPEEIALSICAEIRSVFANRKGMSLRLREGTIHGN
jgi:xanthine/CO dehydrogenase XdhC/CoxF family maturation factor